MRYSTLLIIDYSASRPRSVSDHPVSCSKKETSSAAQLDTLVPRMYESTTLLSITYLTLLLYFSSALLLLCGLHIDYQPYTIGTIEA